MRAILNKIEHILVTNTVWVFLTVITTISFMRIMLASEGMVYLEAEKWQLYGYFVFGHIILFTPVLLFSYFRESLKNSLPNIGFWSLWFYCFLVHTMILFHFNLAHLFPPLRAQVDTPVIFGLTILLVELIIQFNDFILLKLNLKKRLQKWSLEKVLFALVLLFAVYWTYATTKNNVLFTMAALFDLFKWLIVFLACYVFYWINHYVLIDKVFKNKGILYYLFSFLGLAMCFLPIAALLINQIHFEYWYLAAEKWVPTGERTTRFQVFPNYLPWIWMLGSIPLILVYQWWKQQHDIVELEKEKSASELNVLKQQVNPHFLFNTLNSLYALGIEEGSEKTADGIAKLGTLMRYNLNDAHKEYIPLSKEIEYIRQYIDLQKLRLTPSNELVVNILSDTSNYQIAPLLLIPFIENAFKYGVSPTEKTHIKLTLRIENDVLIMHIFNTIISNKKQQDGNGIGISNALKRLAHLYPKQYEVIIEEIDNEFEVQLEINLKNTI